MTFHSPGPDGKDKESSNPYKDGEVSKEAGAKEVKAAKPEAGANPKKAAAPKAAKSSKETSSSAAAASAGEKKLPVMNSQETVAAKADVSAEKPGVPTKKPGVMETLRESARVTDPEERTLAYINPLSALKLGASVNVCLLVIVLVASAVIYALLGIAGVWDNLNSLLGDLTGMGSFGSAEYFGIVLTVGIIEVIIFSLLAPVLAVMYNLSAKLVGGLRITVSKRSE